MTAFVLHPATDAVYAVNPSLDPRNESEDDPFLDAVASAQPDTDASSANLDLKP